MAGVGTCQFPTNSPSCNWQPDFAPSSKISRSYQPTTLLATQPTTLLATQQHHQQQQQNGGSSTLQTSLPAQLDNHLHHLLEKGQLHMAMGALLGMDMAPSPELYWDLLKACRNKESLKHAQLLHAHLALHGFESTCFLGESLVITLAKCHSLDDAVHVFHRLTHRTTSSWASIISAYNDLGMYQEALRLYQCMLDDGVQPNKYIFVSVIQACGSIPNLQQGKHIHAQAVKYKCESELFVGACLVDMYAKCGSMTNAYNVFDRLCQRDVVSWNAMLSAYVEEEQAEKVLQLCGRMQGDGVSPNERTFMFSLQACCLLAEKKVFLLEDRSTKDRLLEIGQALHSDAVSHGFDSDIFVGSTLVSFYGNHGCIAEAENVFDGLSQCDVVSCTAMLSAYVEQGQGVKALKLYEQLQAEGVSPDERTFVIALQACCMLAEEGESVAVAGKFTMLKSLNIGQSLHASSLRQGFHSDVFVGGSLVNMYGKCGSIMDAQHVFGGLSQRNAIAWNAMISAHVEQGEGEKALQVYRSMQEYCVNPNEQTFVIALQACCWVADKEEFVPVEGQSRKVMSQEIGQALHADARRRGFDSNVFVGSSLVSLYGKCGNILYAQHAFDRISQHDVVSWTGMLTSYLDQGEGEKSLQLYKYMQDNGVSPNEQTFVMSLQACRKLAEKEEAIVVERDLDRVVPLEVAHALHVDARRKGFGSDAFVCSALVSMYGKCGSIAEAEKVFSGLRNQDVVLWNAMLSAYGEQGNGEQALQMYRIMQDESVTMDDISIACILQACRKTGCLESCRQIHFSMVSAGYDLSLTLVTTLIYTYGSCASMMDAQEVFDRMSHADVVLWNALIAGYAKEGRFLACIQSFTKMQGAGVKPNEVTFLTLLSVCSHAGLSDKGVEFLESMSRDYGLVPEIEHYVSVLDNLGRAGDFRRVEGLLSRMPMQPDLAMTLCLLGACQKHGNVDLGKHAFDHAVHLQPQQDAAYILMSNIYADAGLQECAAEVDNLRERGKWKKPGQQSWSVHKGGPHSFAGMSRQAMAT